MPALMDKHRPSLPRFLVRWLFHRLYHEFAWTYDVVARGVSLGHWYDWAGASLGFVQGARVLELGPGTGHVLEQLAAVNSRVPVGVDDSHQMLRLAQRRLRRAPGPPARLVRGDAASLPFAAESFDTVVSTFPSEYLFGDEAIREACRVLRDDGQVVVVVGAWLDDGSPARWCLRWLLQIVGQARRREDPLLASQLEERLTDAGFYSRRELIASQDAEVLVILGSK